LFGLQTATKQPERYAKLGPKFVKILTLWIKYINIEQDGGFMQTATYGMYEDGQIIFDESDININN
jgi:hypothetical protein